MLELLSDEILMAKLKAGDKSAFSLLYDRYSIKIFRYLLRLLNGHTAKAEDFLQDIFLKIIENNNSFDLTQNFKTWIYSIATNQCRNEWRNTENRARIIENRIPWESDSIKHEDRLEKSDFSKLLNQKLNEMDALTKEIIVLRYYQELSVKEIAYIVSIPEGTVKSKLFYTIKSLSEKLNQFNPKNY
jgi:RNA polymerase sigma-70 factor, ECF subfamily